jgi:lipase chaperone LimK
MKDFSNTIKFSEISKESIDILENIIKKQLIKLNEKAETMEINSLSSIKVQYKGELTKLINDILKDELKLSETNIKFTAKSNIISNSISEKVKSMFLNEFIDKPSIEIDNLTQDIINDL